MSAPPPAPSRPRFLVPLLFGLLALVALIHQTIGLPDFLLYGLVGGLALCLLVVARDSLLMARRQIEKDEDHPRDAERTEGRRDER